MQKRNIIEITDLSNKELLNLINRTLYFSKNIHKTFTTLKSKRIGLVFDSASLRTKVAFEIASHKLGAFPYYVQIDSVTHELDKTTPRECFEDIIDTLDRFVDAYVVRDYSQNILNVLKRKNNPPIINGFSLIGHPSQALADVSVLISKSKDIKKTNICCVLSSNGSGIIESFCYAVLLLGGNITFITPNGKLIPKNKDFFDNIKKMRGKLTITKEGQSTIKKADVLYVDEWWQNKPNFLDIKPPKEYRVNQEFLKGHKENLMILHCLPAHHNREISKDVFYSKNSIVFDEAEFRVYSAMALLEFLLK